MGGSTGDIKNPPNVSKCFLYFCSGREWEWGTCGRTTCTIVDVHDDDDDDEEEKEDVARCSYVCIMFILYTAIRCISFSSRFCAHHFVSMGICVLLYDGPVFSLFFIFCFLCARWHLLLFARCMHRTAYNDMFGDGAVTLELPRRLWCVTGVLFWSVTFVKSLVDFRQRNETTLSEHVRSSVECDVCSAFERVGRKK